MNQSKVLMRKKILHTTLLIFLLAVLPGRILSQEVNIISPYATLQYLKNTYEKIVLKTILVYSGETTDVPLAGAEVSFYLGTEESQLLGSSTTDEKGVAQLELSENVTLTSDADGMWNFRTEYNGNDSIEATMSEISVKDVNLEMELSEVDSVRTVNVRAYVKNKGEEIPVTGELVMLYVPRMFRPLLISELILDENGTASLEFPMDIPGDKEGNLTVLAMFEENFTYGNVEKHENLKWGIPTDYFIPSTHRALWTKTAPKWMIYTLSILLAGVWGHYMFAIISLIRIKIEANRQKAKEEFRY